MPEVGGAWRGPWEALVLVAIMGVAAWLRLRNLDLAEFKLDEANTVELARRVLHGHVQTVGLTASIGARDPPLFIYLIAIPLGLRDDPLFATGFVAVLAVAAVGLTFVVLRPRFGAFAAATAAALFAAAPWAVLYGRKIWSQDALPIFTTLLLWSLYAVLERTRTRAVALVPLLLCVGFQLNFSALALALPAAALLACRARKVHWPAFGIGVAAAVLALAPWLAHEATHGFEDVIGILTQGRGNRGSSVLGSGSFRAARETIHILGASGWDYVVGSSHGTFVAGAAWEWRLARAANLFTAALLILGLATTAVHAARGLHRTPGRRLPALDLPAARRALLLAWLGGVWLSYVASAPGRLAPHYLIVTYPVSFALQALGLADLAHAVRARARRAAAFAAVALVVATVCAYAAFTVSFHRFLGRTGGAVGDYGVVYRDKAVLAAVVEQRRLHVANEPVVEFLANGRVPDAVPGDGRVRVHDRLSDPSSRCAGGSLGSFGPLLACLVPESHGDGSCTPSTASP